MNIKNYFRENKFISHLIYPFEILRGKKINIRKKYFDFFFSNIEAGSLFIKINNIKGVFELNALSHIAKRIIITKNYEPEIVNLINKNINPNLDAINVGANVGIYSNLLADRINANRKVLAIEPNPDAFQYLINNIKLNNKINKIIPFNGVVKDQHGKDRLNIIKGKEEYSSLGQLVHDAIKEKDSINIQVEGETVDRLVKKNKIEPGIILIDVEGAEYKVLLGAIQTIEKFKPIIVSEINASLLSQQNSSPNDIFSFLRKLGYQVYDTQCQPIKSTSKGNIIAKIYL